MSRETLKSLLNNLINDNAEAAAADLHSYLSTKLSVASGIVEAVGDKTKIDSTSLSYLDTAYNAIVKGKGYSDQLKRQAAFIYSKLKPAARRGDSEEFQQIWHELMADKPDAMAEFADEMFAAAGLGHRGTFDKLAKKIGLTEATNRQNGIVEAVGDKTKIDSTSLSYLDTAYNAIVKGKGYSDQLKRQAAFIYSKLKPAARRGDSEEFQQIWHELMADKPDAMAEFADEMFAAAGLGHRGTFDKLAKKIGLTEATNRQHELAREAYRKLL